MITKLAKRLLCSYGDERLIIWGFEYNKPGAFIKMFLTSGTSTAARFSASDFEYIIPDMGHWSLGRPTHKLNMAQDYYMLIFSADNWFL
jgi:hypothetical protein